MSNRIKSPKRMVGGPALSGHVNTGEVQWTRGGQQTATIWSGGVAPAVRSVLGGASSGNQITVVSGAGRLHSVHVHSQMVSGVTVYFYDNDLPLRSGAGPVAALMTESGARVLGVIPTTYAGGEVAGGVSGYAQGIYWQYKWDFDMPFTSGLYISAASGAPGFSFSYTTEQRILSGQGGYDGGNPSI